MSTFLKVGDKFHIRTFTEEQYDEFIEDQGVDEVDSFLFTNEGATGKVIDLQPDGRIGVEWDSIRVQRAWKRICKGAGVEGLIKTSWCEVYSALDVIADRFASGEDEEE